MKGATAAAVVVAIITVTVAVEATETKLPIQREMQWKNGCWANASVAILARYQEYPDERSENGENNAYLGACLFVNQANWIKRNCDSESHSWCSIDCCDLDDWEDAACGRTGNANDIEDTINEYLPGTPPYGNQIQFTGDSLTKSEVNTLVTTNKTPAVLWWEGKCGGSTHAVVIAGYDNSTGSEKVWVMDSHKPGAADGGYWLYDWEEVNGCDIDCQEPDACDREWTNTGVMDDPPLNYLEIITPPEIYRWDEEDGDTDTEEHMQECVHEDSWYFDSNGASVQIEEYSIGCLDDDAHNSCEIEIYANGDTVKLKAGVKVLKDYNNQHVGDDEFVQPEFHVHR